MKTRLLTVLAVIAALVLGSAPLAAAKPYKGSMTVTYSIGILQGTGEKTFVRYRNPQGYTYWDIVTAPWSTTMSMDTSPSIYAYSLTYGNNIHSCTLTINGKVYMHDDGYDGSVQCYKSY